MLNRIYALIPDWIALKAKDNPKDIIKMNNAYACIQDKVMIVYLKDDDGHQIAGDAYLAELKLSPIQFINENEIISEEVEVSTEVLQNPKSGVGDDQNPCPLFNQISAKSIIREMSTDELIVEYLRLREGKTASPDERQELMTLCNKQYKQLTGNNIYNVVKI